MMNVVNTEAIVFSSETLDLFNMFRTQSCSLDARISQYAVHMSYHAGRWQRHRLQSSAGSLLTISTGPGVASVLPAFLENVS